MANTIRVGSGMKTSNGTTTKFPGASHGRRKGGCSSCRGKR